VNIVALAKRLWSLKGDAETGLSVRDHALTAYERGASLPGILRIAGGITQTGADDRADDAVLAALGEAKQALFNAEQGLRAAIGGTQALLVNATGLADQLRGLFDFLDAAEKGPLKDILEGSDGPDVP